MYSYCKCYYPGFVLYLALCLYLTLRRHHCHGNTKQNETIFRTQTCTFRQHSGFNDNTLSPLSQNTRVLRISTVISSHTSLILTHTNSPHPITWTCLPWDYFSFYSWAPTSLFFFYLFLPPWAHWAVWHQVFVVGCSSRQVQTISGCLYMFVIFKSLFMVRVLKGDIFMVIVAGLFYYIFM